MARAGVSRQRGGGEGEVIKNIISTLREWKSRHGMPLNAPLKSVEVVAPGNADVVREGAEVISGTINISSLDVLEDLPPSIREVNVISPVHSRVGPEFKANSRAVISEIESNGDSIIRSFEEGNNYRFVHDGSEMEIRPEHVKIERKLEGEGVDLISVGDIIISIGE